MEVNWTNLTVTSSDIIKGLLANNVNLQPSDKQLIIDRIYKALTNASGWESNGCDCGQMWCSTCHG